MKKALVTGGKGFIGSHLMEQLERRGYEVESFDIKDGQDIRDTKQIWGAMKDKDVVFNLAGVLGTHELIEGNIVEAVEINVIGALNVLEGGRKYGVDVVEIGKPNIWLNTYSITKRAGEDFALMYNKEFGVNTWVIKWYNIFGPRQHYGSPQKLAPTSIVRALRGEPIPVYNDGMQTADHLYVVDAANAAIDTYECKEAIGEIVEIGSGEEMTVHFFVDKVLEFTGSDSPIDYQPMRRGEDDDAKVRADIEKLTNLVGFKPEYDFDDALKLTIEYYKENLDNL